jgi:hypothetical protein
MSLLSGNGIAKISKYWDQFPVLIRKYQDDWCTWGEKSKITINPRSKVIRRGLQAFFLSITVRQQICNSISAHSQVIGYMDC